MRALFIRSITIVAHRIRSLPPTTSSSNRLIGKALIASALMSGIALHAAQLRTDNSALDPVDAELAIEATEHALAPSSDDYVRIDLTTLASPEFRESFLQSNALHDTLNGQGMIETFQVFHHKTDSDLFSIVKFGDRVNGYPGLVHGGISSLVMDSLYGWTFMANKLPPAFTANLTLNYRYASVVICIALSSMQKYIHCSELTYYY